MRPEPRGRPAPPHPKTPRARTLRLPGGRSPIRKPRCRTLRGPIRPRVRPWEPRPRPPRPSRGPASPGPRGPRPLSGHQATHQEIRPRPPASGRRSRFGGPPPAPLRPPKPPRPRNPRPRPDLPTPCRPIRQRGPRIAPDRPCLNPPAADRHPQTVWTGDARWTRRGRAARPRRPPASPSRGSGMRRVPGMARPGGRAAAATRRSRLQVARPRLMTGRVRLAPNGPLPEARASNQSPRTAGSRAAWKARKGQAGGARPSWPFCSPTSGR